MKITGSQRKALKTIAENPGNVVAYVRGGAAGRMVKINGNAENSLIARGLAVAVDTDVKLYRDEDGTKYLQCWELTDLGREAIGITTAPGVHPLTGMTTYQLADHLSAHVDTDTLARIGAPDMHDLIDRLQRSGHVSDERFRALVDEAAAA